MPCVCAHTYLYLPVHKSHLGSFENTHFQAQCSGHISVLGGEGQVLVCF